MSKKLPLFLLFIFLGNFVFGQTNFKEGYIVGNNQDTIYGLLDDRSQAKNSKLIRFKPSPDDEIARYSPDELEGYKIGKQIYLSRNLLDRSVSFEDLSSNAFVQLINDGAVKFYTWKDKSLDELFFIEKYGKVYLLKNEMKRVNLRDRVYMKESNEYKMDLRKLTSDCPRELSAENVGFTKKSISNYITEYNNCMSTDNYTSPVVNKKMQLKKTILIGGGISNVNVSGSLAEFSESDSKIVPAVGLGLHADLPMVHKSILFDLFIEYQQKGAEATDNTVSFDLHYINLTPGISYNYPKGRVKPFLGGGFVIGKLLNVTSAYTKLNDAGQSVRIFNRPNFRNNEVGYELGFQLRGGLAYVLGNGNSLLLNVKYSYTEIPFNLPYESYQNTNWILQLGYRFE